MNEELKECILKMAEARDLEAKAADALRRARRKLDSLIGGYIVAIYANAADPESPLELPGTKSSEREHLLYINSLVDRDRAMEDSEIRKAQNIVLDLELAHQEALIGLKQEQYTFRALLNEKEYERLD